MDLAHPFLLVTPTLDGPVLQALLTVEHLENAAEIHRRAGTGSAPGVRKVLRRLVEQGIVDEVDHGNAKYYRLNRRHAAYDVIVALGAVRSVIADRLTERLGLRTGLLHASLAPFAGDTLHILLIAETAADLAAPMWTYLDGELATEIRHWTGNSSDIAHLTRAGFDDLVAKQDPVVMTWRRENTHLCGTPIIELMNYAYFG